MPFCTAVALSCVPEHVLEIFRCHPASVVTIWLRQATSTGGLVPIFEARVDSPYAYLNSGFFLSSNPGVANGGVKITMYESTNSK
jgi:hypothetical protein